MAERDQHRVALSAAAAELESQADVAEEILRIRDLDQLLLSIVNRTLVLLDSDICGILMRDGDTISMKACVGHRVIDTAHLSMHRGQGLAGLVFASGRHGRVDSYVDDRTISPDFVSLAEQEETRSALAIPLIARGDIIGVLEVWRRRPSLFTEVDVRRMLALGTLATIAIENARLADLQAETLTRLSSAHEVMEHHVAQLDRGARLQSALLRIVLERGNPFDRIMRTVANEYGCAAVLRRENGSVEAAFPHLIDEDLEALPAPAPRGRTHGEPQMQELADGRRVWSQPVITAEHSAGTVSLIGGTADDEELRTAVTQVAMACALARLEQRAASQARSTAFEQIVWDLVEGPPEHRSAALSRAGELGLSLAGTHRVVRGAFDNLDHLAQEGGWDTATVDGVRRNVVSAMRK
ncbi:MAG: GAF domain-containing protein, partial [Microbacterium sp.]